MAMNVATDMNKVTISKQKLIDVLTLNRTMHIADYQAALVEWEKQYAKALRRELRANVESKTGSVYLEKPVSYQNSYDTALRMLDLALEAEFVLTERQFRQYVMDEWDWKDRFVSNTMSYSSIGK